jgi:hypothetical protein
MNQPKYYEVKIFKQTSPNPIWRERQFKTTKENMKELQIKFSSQFMAMFLLVTHVKSKKTCKPGQEDVTSQPFDLSARGECEIFLCNSSRYPTTMLSDQN